MILSLQVCLLNIKDEPMVEACIAVCSARIICIAAVPGLKGRSVHAHTHTCTDYPTLVLFYLLWLSSPLLSLKKSLHLFCFVLF